MIRYIPPDFISSTSNDLLVHFWIHKGTRAFTILDNDFVAGDW